MTDYQEIPITKEDYNLYVFSTFNVSSYEKCVECSPDIVERDHWRGKYLEAQTTLHLFVNDLYNKYLTPEMRDRLLSTPTIDSLKMCFVVNLLPTIQKVEKKETNNLH